MDLLAAARQVRLLAMDIDGTLTDGSIWIGPQGECAKRFSVRDGFGIKLLQKAGIKLAIITGRRSEIVARRAEELGIRHVFQDVPDKLVVLKELGAQLGIGLQETAFIGDDWPDLAAMQANPVLATRWYQVEFLATLSGEMLVTMVYHRPLDDAWEAAARQLQTALGIHVIGRSRGQKRVLSQDFVIERLEIPGPDGAPPAPFLYRQPEGAFTQPNARMCERMIGWACEAVQQAGISPASDLLELYCGNGNFTLPLSRRFRRVLATEVSKTSVQAAQWNISANGADNIRIARLSAEEFTEAFNGSREFRRLQEQQIDLAEYGFSTVFVDPPRAGVDDDTLKLLARFDRIIYISCNPETLRANLDALLQTHTVERAALFDQFPFTGHIESGLLLHKKAV